MLTFIGRNMALWNKVGLFFSSSEMAESHFVWCAQMSMIHKRHWYTYVCIYTHTHISWTRISTIKLNALVLVFCESKSYNFKLCIFQAVKQCVCTHALSTLPKKIHDGGRISQKSSEPAYWWVTRAFCSPTPIINSKNTRSTSRNSKRVHIIMLWT